MPLSSSSAGKLKMLYRLEPDDDGYPPVSTEGLWVRPLDSGTVILDNIPFYAKGIAPGDELAVLVGADGETWFQALVSSGGRSVFRIHAESDQQVAKIREELLGLGTPSEVDSKTYLIAVEVPANADISPILDYLVVGQDSSRFDFEEGALRHAIPD
jgi:hypothetical protein